MLPLGAILPEHQAPASRSDQDSYVSKGGRLGGVGAQRLSNHACPNFRRRLNKHRETKSVNPPLDALEP